MHDTLPPPPTLHLCTHAPSARHSVSLPWLSCFSQPPHISFPRLGAGHTPQPQATRRTAEPPHPGLEGEREVIWCSSHSLGLSPPGQGSGGVSTPPDTNTSSQTHPDTTADRHNLGPPGRRQTVLAGPDRTRSSHTRTRTRTRTMEHATTPGKAEMPRAGRCPSDPAHKDTPTYATDPAAPGGPVHTLNRGTPDGRAGSRRPGRGAQGSRSPSPPLPPRRHPMTLDPQCRTHARPGRPEHLPPSWRLRGRGAGGRGGGRGRGLRAGSGAGSGWGASAAPAPRSARPSGRQPSRTESAAAAASASSYARARGGAGAGQSGAPPP